MKRTNSMVWGIVLLIVGIVLTLGQFPQFKITENLILPIILLALALLFHLYFFLSSAKNEGLLVPGGILLVYGLMFLPIFGYNLSLLQLLPFFILGPALGLLELYIFSRGRSGSLIPVFILAVFGGSLLLIVFKVANFDVIIAAVLICLGLALMVNAFFRRPRSNQGTQPVSEVKSVPKVEPIIDVKAETSTEETPK